uniref:Uncharacterized protein n=1 Tax=Caenorhabditis japonica TaxID=281687 RepID=A0A8R1IVD0_CAEJA
MNIHHVPVSTTEMHFEENKWVRTFRILTNLCSVQTPRIIEDQYGVSSTTCDKPPPPITKMVAVLILQKVEASSQK